MWLRMYLDNVLRLHFNIQMLLRCVEADTTSFKCFFDVISPAPTSFRVAYEFVL